MPTGWQWLPVALGALLVYELLRSTLVRWIKARYEAQVDKFLHQHDIPVDGFRHTHRVVVKERVLADPGLVAAIDARARADGRTFHDVRKDVKAWLDEIVPQFNLLAYYKVGYALGRTAAYATYNVRLDKESLARAQAKIPDDAAVVYVSNHRSNADFVVTGFMLSKSVQVSYAVGEWARVWPLESLFKAFGSYFVRRGEKDPLYHRTLEAYLQLVTKQGVTQAMFPEGGLTRDGRLREPKLGLLDYMARAKLDPAFRRPLVFVPVGINFDRVLEDDNMVYEAEHGRPKYRKRGVGQKLARLITLTGKLLWGWPLNAARFMAKRLKKHGIAAIHFGEPVVFDDWYAQQAPFLGHADRHVRYEALRPFADQLMGGIARNIPVTPVTALCHAMQHIGRDRIEAGVDRGAILLALRRTLDAARAAGRPMAVTDPYTAPAIEHHRHVAHITDDVEAAEATEAVFERAWDVVQGRGILHEASGVWWTTRWDLVTYYARSIGKLERPDQPAVELLV
ncbi:MAG: 1-acyl-sn-glycerol-3-phosphate acyltransferase [Thermoplasmatota archaeon]